MTIQDIETKLKALEVKLLNFVNSNKIWLVLLAVPLVILKYRSFIIDLLIKDSNQIVTDTTKKDAQLKTDEDQNNKKADSLVTDAQNKKTESDNQEVDENWYKK